MATSPIYSWPEPDNTDLVKNGALSIRTLGNAIDTTMGTMVAKTVVDAKGDLIAGTAADTVNRLAVGANGESLVADASTATGLRWQGDYAAGKNYFINPDLFINQRQTSSTTDVAVFLVDRFRSGGNGAVGGHTYSVEQFTVGTTLGTSNPKQYLRVITTGQTSADTATIVDSAIEDVRKIAGKTLTVSFWAKAASGTPKIALEIDQQFGTGGSPSTRVRTYTSQVTLSTNWERKSITFTAPSLSGKTIGTDANSSFTRLFFWISGGTNNASNNGSLGIQSNTFDLWGFQCEEGSVATAFQTATGTIQGELAACQRYYFRTTSSTGGQTGTGISGITNSTTNLVGYFTMPVNMRTASITIDFSNIGVQTTGSGLTSISAVTFATDNTSSCAALNFTSSGFTANLFGLVRGTSGTGYFGLSAEL